MKAMIEIKNLSAGYREKEVLHGICVCLERGKLTSVIGVNGSGKSTFLKTIVGISSCFDGEICLDGENVSNIKRNERAKKIAYLSQGSHVPNMTVSELVLSGRFPHLSYPRIYTERDREIAVAAMQRLGIASLSDAPLSSLSGGMRQTAYIAMALAQDTEYILLDEPTTYLDISHQLELMGILRELADCGKGIITVMHDLPLAFASSDALVLLCDGRVRASGTPDALCASDAIFDSFGVRIKKDSDGRYFYDVKK